MYVSAFRQPQLLARLHQAGVLPEGMRHEAVTKLHWSALNLDCSWLDGPVSTLLTDDELGQLLTDVQRELFPSIEEHIDSSGEGYTSDVEPYQRFSEAKAAVDALTSHLRHESSALSRLTEASAHIEWRISEAEATFAATPVNGPSLAPKAALVEHSKDRDIFDDIAEGR